VDWFPTVFYSLLLQTLQDIRAKHAHLILCCLTANAKEGFDVMGGGKLFEVHATEAKALSLSKH
jgi:anti-anti-sigma regulatory factor